MAHTSHSVRTRCLLGALIDCSQIFACRFTDSGYPHTPPIAMKACYTSQLNESEKLGVPQLQIQGDEEAAIQGPSLSPVVACAERPSADNSSGFNVLPEKRADELQDTIALVGLIKSCTKQKDLLKGIRIHIDILKKGLLKKNIYVATALIDFYAKCGALAKAQQIFDELPVRSVVSWNALIGGYAEWGHGVQALSCFLLMQAEGLDPDIVTFICILKACTSIQAIEKGEEIHAEVSRKCLLGKSIVLGNTLVDMYVKCGKLHKAQQVFDKFPIRNVVSWTTLIDGYTQHGHADEALNIFEQMQYEGLHANALTFVCVLQACGSIGAVEKGEQIYAEVKSRGLLETNVALGATVVNMYVKCGELAKAQSVFDELLMRDVVTWNALIAGYSQQGGGVEALSCLRRMKDEGFSPNTVTFISILKACASIGAVKEGKEIHAEIRRQGLLGKNIALDNALVDLYAKCGILDEAQNICDELQIRNAASWTALIAGYAKQGYRDETMKCLRTMCNEGLSPDATTFVCILNTPWAAEKIEDIHAEIIRQGLLEKSIELGNSLVDVYAKCGLLAKAQEMLDHLPLRNVFSWTALIAGFTLHEDSEEALECFARMQDEGVSPNAVTFVYALNACGTIGSLKTGEVIHDEACRLELLEKDIVLSNALIDMYAKCGNLTRAREVFDDLLLANVVSWTALIMGYAQAGKVDVVLELFIKIIDECIELDSVAYCVLLTACSHAGLLEEGQICFELMDRTIRNLEHHACIVDLFSRAGNFSKALCLIDVMPQADCLLLWSGLLGSCGKWMNVEVGKRAFEHLISLDENLVAAYVGLSDTFATASMQVQSELWENV